MEKRVEIMRTLRQFVLRIFISAMSLSVAGIGCSLNYKMVRKGQLNEPMVKDIQNKVSYHRGLPYIKPVRIEVIKREDAAILFRKAFEEEYPPERLYALERSYKKIGLISPNVDIKKMVLDFYSENIAGFYDPKRKKLYLIREVVERFSLLSFIFQRDSGNEFLVAHELTHALDDQHFDLEAMNKRARGNDDALLATQALEEGTATLVSFAVMYHGKMDMKEVIEVLALYNKLIGKLIRLVGGGVPPILLDTVVFAYITGSNFTAYLYKTSNDWSKINAAYKNAPASSEEVMYPKKFIKKSDPPSKINMVAPPQSFGQDWKLLESNTFGELGVYSLLRRFLRKSAAKSAARGWGGDRYVVVGSTDEKSTLWMWVTEWDSEKEAGEFHAAYHSILPLKHKGIRSAVCPVNTGKCWSNNSGELIWIKRDGKRITIIEGADEKTLPIAVKHTTPSPSLITYQPQISPARPLAPAAASLSTPLRNYGYIFPRTEVQGMQ